MEIMLNPLFEKHQDKLISLAEIEGLTHTHEHSHEVEEEKPVNTIQEQEPQKQEDDGQHIHTKQDMHIWTSPKNALVMAKHITKVLSKLDAKNQDIYEKNLATFGEELAQESMQISQNLNNKIGKPYIVFHNSWQYFAHEFGLADPIVLNIQEGLSSGAKKLKETRDLIAELGIRCVFTDSSISQAQIDALLSKQEGKEIRVVEIDVLGKKIEPSQDAYLSWLKDMGNSISKCL
ncbi:High-affinity zinc uptake system protein ZnuA [Nymphon striatum]|nr:High-affinity zinc uptake system protein ZnuA [Nymphon striatum]